MKSISVLFFLISIVSCTSLAQNEDADMAIPDGMSIEIASLGAGCFWCVEAVFQDLKGVYKVESGYMGGRITNPTYREVCSGTTGHAEIAQVHFNPEEISFATILEVFWATHDPTTLNRQGNDAGTQYRSAIFYHTEAQKAIAEKSKSEVATTLWSDPIVTEITAASTYYPAEDYHQNYFNENPNAGYCRVIINPKVKKARKEFSHLLKEDLK